MIKNVRITDKTAKWIIIIYTIVVSVIIFSLPASAKDFADLSEQAKKDYITSLTEQISKDLGIQTVPKLYFYNCSEWCVIASYYDYIDYIYVNLGNVNSYEDAVRTMAHEIRHDYQYEHINDDSDYGRAIKANNQNYVSYYIDLEAYNNQFIEQDAKDYADSYTEKYFNLVR